MDTPPDDLVLPPDDLEQPSGGFVLGAPGTTKTDIEEGTSSLKLKPIKEGKVTTELPPDDLELPPDDLEIPEGQVDTAQYGDRAWLHTNTGYGATEKNIVAGTDMVLTLPIFFAKMGLSGLSDIAHAVAGSDAPMQETDKLLANMDKTQFGRFLNAPLATIMKEGFNKDTSNSGVEHVMSAIMQPFMDAETHWQKESGQNLSGLGTRMANITMAKGLEVTGKGIKKGYEKLDPAGAKERAAIKEYDKKAKAKEILKQAEESSKAVLTKELGRTATPEEHMALVRLMANEHASEADVGNYIETLKKKDVSTDEQVKSWEQEVAKEQAENTPETSQEAPQGVKDGEVIPEVPKDQRGAVDKELLIKGGLATAAGAYIAAQTPEERNQILGGLGVAAGALMTKGHLPPEVTSKFTMGQLLEHSTYTTTALDRLPKGKAVITPEQIKSVMNQKDITAVDKKILTGILDKTTDTGIPAIEVMKAFNEEIKPVKLDINYSQKYAPFGLDRIDRQLSPDEILDREEVGLSSPIPPDSTTKVYTTGELAADFSSHFPEYNGYFGHTRSFFENGKEHVVEVQSDRAQTKVDAEPLLYKETLKEWNVDRIDYERQREVYEEDLALEKRLANNPIMVDLDRINYLKKALSDLETHYQNHLKQKPELKDFTYDKVGVDKDVAPFLKNYRKRLVNEEVWQASKMDQAAIRFATADTVATIEGWPREYSLPDGLLERLDQAENKVYTLRYASGDIKYSSKEVKAEHSKKLQEADQELAKVRKELIDFKANSSPSLMRPGHQDLYKKHKKEVEQYVLDKGGKIVTDNSGYTWVELPLKSQKKPINVTGNIDPKLAIGMGAAAAGAVAGSILADDNKVLGGVLGAAVGGLGAAFKLSKKAGGTNPLNKVYNLPDAPPVRDLSKGAPHPAAMVSEQDFQATGKEVLKLHGPEAAKEFARQYQEYRAKNYVKVPEQMEDLPDALYNVDTKEKLNDSELVKALEMSEQAGFTTDLRSSLYQALDKGEKLTQTQQFQFDKFIKPLLDELAALHSKTGTGTVVPVNTSNFFGYLPRIRMWTPSTAKERLGKVWDDMTRTEGAFAQKMNESPDGLMERNIFVHEDINGKRTVVQARGEDFLFKLEKEDPTQPKPEAKTRDKPKQKVDSTWKVGDVIPAGKVRGLKSEGRLVEAKVWEIEANSDMKYSKDILLNVLVRRNELLKLDREKTFLREFANSKQFDSIGKDIISKETGKVNELPVGWKIPQHIDRIPELAGKAFDPKIAAILEDWAKTYEKSMYLNLTSALIKNMMLNPIPHIANEVMHLVNIRGVSGWTTGLPAYVRSARKGASDVLGQSANYQAVLREGGSLLSADVRNKQAIRDLFDKEAKKAFNDPLVQRDIKNLAAQMGVKPIEVYNAISKFSNKWMWTTRDMMYMGLVREAQAKYPGKTLKEIIYEIERHMPAYRLPSEIAGSRTLSKFVGNPNLSVFSRYHYGMVKSLMETGKDLKPQNLKTKEGRDKFKHGANAAAMIAISYGILYPLADEIAKEMFSDLENVEQRRAGPYHLIHAGVEVIEGKKDPQAILAPIYTVNPMLLWGTQLVANRELYSGKQIYHPNDTSGMIAEDLGKYIGKAIPQYTPMNQAMADDSGEGTKAFLARQIDIKAKTKEQARRAATMKYYAERDRLVRQAKDRAGR